MKLAEIVKYITNLFEKKRKNPIQLERDSNLESKLKFLKVSNKATPIQISEDTVNIEGSLNVNGSAVQTGTDAGATQLDELSDVTYSNGDLTITSLDKIVASGDLKLEVGGDIELNADGADITLKDGIVTIAKFAKSITGVSLFYSIANVNDYFKIDVGTDGATTLSTTDADTTAGHMTLASDGDLILDPVSQKTIINATDGLYLDGGGDTYIYEAAGDVVRHIVGGDRILVLSEKGDDGNEVNFGESCAGFTQLEPTYDATTTNVDFRHSNKQFLTFGSGNITSINCIFPLVSGNFVLLLKQDGTGSRTVTNWKAAEFDESAADGSATIKFAGGSNPTLTTDANHVDIISIYWDADNQIAYGVATLDFQF